MAIVKLGEVAEVTAGQPAPKGKDAFGKKGLPFVRAGSLEGLLNGKSEEELELVDTQKAKDLKLKLFPPKTILFAKSGMSAKLGRVYSLKKSSYVVSHLAAVIPNERVVPEYLHWWFEKNPPSKLIPNDSYPSIRISAIQGLQLDLPPLPEQKRIATILEKADAIRRNRKRAVSLYENFLRSIFLDMFGDPLTNPMSWPTDELGSLGKVSTGNTPSRKSAEYYGSGIEWVKSDNINTPYHFLTTAEECLSPKGENVARTVPANSILVTCIAGSPSCIGNVAIADRKVAFNQQINAIVPSSNVKLSYLYSCFLFRKELVQAKSTDGMKGLVSKSRFESIVIPIPREDLQGEYDKCFKSFLKTLSRHTQAEQVSDDLFGALAQGAFNGEL